MSMSRHNSDKKIDTALRLLGHTRPPDDFEQRLRSALNKEALRPRKDLIARAGDFLFARRFVFAAPAVAAACVLIVIGSVQHSHQRTLLNTGVHVSAPGSGLGAASSTHISPQPVAAPEHGRSRSQRKAAGGRATVLRNAHKPAGVAVPDSTSPQKP